MTNNRTIKLPIAKIAALVLDVAKVGVSAVYLHVDGVGIRVDSSEQEGNWLAVAKWDLVNADVRTKRAADAVARVLINRAADHLNAYPDMFETEIAHVKVPRSY